MYTVDAGAGSTASTVPAGEVPFTDPAGTIYDRETFDNARNAGIGVTEARGIASIPGAMVRLQRPSCGTFKALFDGDRGITPGLATENTGRNGLGRVHGTQTRGPTASTCTPTATRKWSAQPSP